MLHCINPKFKNHPKLEKINESPIPIITQFDKTKKSYFLNFTKIKNKPCKFKFYEKLAKQDKKIYLKGLTKVIKNKWYKRLSIPNSKNEFKSSSKKMGIKVHRELKEYTKNKKKDHLSQYTRAIIDHFKKFKEELFISELPILSNKEKFFDFSSQIDLITIKDNKLIGYELKTFYPCENSKTTFKNELEYVKDSKINRSYLQVFYNKNMFKETYGFDLDEFYVICVYIDKIESVIKTERVEHPNWYNDLNKNPSLILNKK